MIWLLTAVLCVAVVETMIRLPLLASASEAVDLSRRAARVLRATSVSDHWKEIAMRSYAARLLCCTAKTAALFGAVFAPVIAAVLLLGDTGAVLGEFVVSWPGLLYSSAVAIAYVALRRRFA